MMPDIDLPTLQQRVERVLDGVRKRNLYEIRTWPPSRIAAALYGMHDDFSHDDEAEIARAASVWLRKVNHG